MPLVCGCFIMPQIVLNAANIRLFSIVQGENGKKFPFWGNFFRGVGTALPRTDGGAVCNPMPESGLRGCYFTNVVSASSRPTERMPSCMRITCSSEMYCPWRYWRISEAFTCKYSANLLTFR